MTVKPYDLFQGLGRFTKKHNKIQEQMRGLFKSKFYTEQEMIATIVDLAEEGTFFIVNGGSTDWTTLKDVRAPFGFTLYCDKFLNGDGTVDKDKLMAEYNRLRQICVDSWNETLEKSKSKGK